MPKDTKTPANTVREKDADGPAPEREPNRLVVVSNRVANLKAKAQTGGLAVALADALRASKGLWFGWSGETSADARETLPKVETAGELTVATVDLTPEEADGYYLGYSNHCLWPTLHYRLDLALCNEDDAEQYFSVNARFAENLIPLLQPGDMIWVHDYHLIPLAEELKRRGCTARIGFFLHTPFPSPEIFAAVPHQKRLGNALMAFDVVGFQTKSDRENFARYVYGFMNGEKLAGDILTAQGQSTHAAVFPIGIDVESFAKLAAKDDDATKLLPDYGEEGMKTIIGVDRLDYTKGLPERLRAFEALLEQFPQHRRHVRFVQIAPPTRETLPVYQEIRREVERLVGKINGRFGDLDWQPVIYLHRPFPQDILARLCRESAVGLITPLRDGMNLVAKEYIAAQRPEDPGVLVLSRFAGAAEQLREALLINPHDINEMARTLDRALTMPRQERWARFNRLKQRIETYDVTNWRDSFLQTFASSDADPINVFADKLGVA
ncbi:trehalose-6-phosphate synthase [Methyloligella sp. 2.7D]|uniref:alpha,alpha-trehalose-phosphate synthase (UDP-forming) n=1 Tax=unclassified Methyloligella TaxID=2625955 RepID=UPI00157C4559|nr:trehalose-6-phosphate synthase [Methyloligella sp. GL2]QKP76995.1 trehalose-6-phosphate synthase [Methyloligella sp. GL2]